MEDSVKKIVTEIWDDMCDRRGFDLGCLDEDIQEEIKETWGKIIKKILKTAPKRR